MGATGGAGAGAAGWLAGLPKVELHIHLEGSIRPPLLLELARRNGVDVGARTVEDLAARYRFRDFQHFIELYLIGMSAIRTGDDLVDAIDALALDLAAQQVGYAEVTTTAYGHHVNGMATSDYRDALDTGARRASHDHGVELRWIIDIPRSLEDPGEGWTADLVTGPDAPADTVAIGLGGPEAEYPAEWYASSMERARAAGVPAVIHAGEVAGPASVRAALDVLGAVRIGHGVRAMEDPTLVAELAAQATPVEVSVTSNILLGVFASLADHPLPAMLDAGVNVSLNTDDPGYFSTTLTGELVIAHQQLGVSLDAIHAAQRRAVEAALCLPALKATLQARLAAFTSPG